MLAYVVDKPIVNVDSNVDLLEIRFDLYKSFIPKRKKWILTVRRKKDGGLFEGSENERLELLNKLLLLRPDYLDLESDVPIDFAKKIKKIYPKVKLIRSIHDFEKTPSNLEKYFACIYHPLFDIHKIATFANSSLDSLKMMKFVQHCKYKITGLCMGEKGLITRLGPLFNNAIDYTSNNPINGQISLGDLINLYRYPNITKDTEIFALIGALVSHSIGHQFHNWFFQKTKKRSLYVKIPIEKYELSDFFKLIETLPFSGLSITTPLKEEIKKYCRSSFGPINTLIRKDHQWLGCNTDGKGVMLSLLKKGKNILVLGAGATAKAIVQEGINEDLRISVFHRDFKKAKRIFHTKVQVLKALIDSNHFDTLINATSCGYHDNTSPVPKKWLKGHLTVLDVVYKDVMTTLIKDACEKKCRVLSGVSLFFYQAFLQQKIWQRKKINKSYIDEFKKIWKQDLHQLTNEL